MGENPAMSDPDVDHAREAIAALDHLVVQDIFLTETAYLADVVLPATAWPEKIGTVTNTDRMVQLGRKAIDPPGDAREDLVDHQRGAHAHRARLALLAPAARCSTRCAPCMDSIAGHHLGATRARVVGHLSVPEGRRPRPAGRLRRPASRRRRAAASSCRPISSPRPSGPTRSIRSVLITGRQLEHWHTGAMTRRRASVLDHIEPEPVASVHPLDLAALGVDAGRHSDDCLAARQISLYARADDGMPRGAVVRAVLLLRSGGEHADQPGRSIRSARFRSSVLRGPRDERWTDARN